MEYLWIHQPHISAGPYPEVRAAGKHKKDSMVFHEFLFCYFFLKGRKDFVCVDFLSFHFFSFFFCLEKKRKKMKLNGLGGMFFGRVEGGKTM